MHIKKINCWNWKLRET